MIKTEESSCFPEWERIVSSYKSNCIILQEGSTKEDKTMSL